MIVGTRPELKKHSCAVSWAFAWKDQMTEARMADVEDMHLMIDATQPELKIFVCTG